MTLKAALKSAGLSLLMLALVLHLLSLIQNDDSYLSICSICSSVFEYDNVVLVGDISLIHFKKKTLKIIGISL